MVLIIKVMVERINRYIMECKQKGRREMKKFELRINRYIMECKFKSV